jgi:hypothetical protein
MSSLQETVHNKLLIIQYTVHKLPSFWGYRDTNKIAWYPHPAPPTTILWKTANKLFIKFKTTSDER